MNYKKRVWWIDITKFFASIFVFIIHYHGIFYKYNDIAPELNYDSIAFFNSIPSPFFNGNFWVFIFCLLSGFVSFQTNIFTFKDFVKTSFIKYLKLVLYIFTIHIIIYIMFVFCLFKNNEYGYQYHSSWSTFYFNNITTYSIIKNSFVISGGVNSPLWMLGYLLTGDILVLYIKFILNKKNSFKTLFLHFVILILIILYIIKYFNSDYYRLIFCTTFGIVLYILYSHRNTLINFISLLLIILFYVNPINNYFCAEMYGQTKYIIPAFLLLMFLSTNRIINSVSINTTYFGSLSLSIYLIHWPIICSFSCQMMILNGDYTQKFWFTIIATLIITLLISNIFTKHVGKYINKIVNLIKTQLYRENNLWPTLPR